MQHMHAMLTGRRVEPQHNNMLDAQHVMMLCSQRRANVNGRAYLCERRFAHTCDYSGKANGAELAGGIISLGACGIVTAPQVVYALHGGCKRQLDDRYRGHDDGHSCVVGVRGAAGG